MSSNDQRLLAIVERVLETGVSPREACAEHPELLAEVNERLAAMRVLDATMETVFPSHRSGADRMRWLNRRSDRLPEIPGYAVESVVGSGGAGVVYRARHLTLKRPVAIKMLLAGAFAGANELARFRREAESIAALCHPNIVQVFDAGECEGRPFYTMEFMEGGTLAAKLGGVPQSAAVSATWGLTLARAVQAAHAHGIVHRDLKPGNILLTGEGTLKIADFGLARSMDGAGEESALTLEGARIGTPSYMAPEQATGSAGAFCPSVDIYALGAILYEMITGRPPFRGENPIETQRQVISDEPVPPTRLNSRTPRDLETICLKCLRKEPRLRYASASELADDVERFLKCEPILARPLGRAGRVMKWVKRRPAAAALVVVLAGGAAAAVGVGAWLQGVEQDRRTQSAVREASARDAITSAIAAIDRSRDQERWEEGQNALTEAQARLRDAHSEDIAARLRVCAENLRVARRLDEIRRSYPGPGESGYEFASAAVAIDELFSSLGLGAQADRAALAERVRSSPIREQLLAGLDNAAFLMLVNGGPRKPDDYLGVARLVDPDPWQAHFRDEAAWRDRDLLLKLVGEARSEDRRPPAHQLVIIGVLLAGLGENDETIRLLHEAHLRDPANFWINHELADAYTRARRPVEACQHRRAALAAQPMNYVLWTSLGVELNEAGLKEEAAHAYRKATELNPGYALAWRNSICQLVALDRLDEAHEALRVARQHNPTATELDYCLSPLVRAREYARACSWARAARAYEHHIRESGTSDGEVWFEYAAVLLLAGEAVDYERTVFQMMDQARTIGLRKYLASRAVTLAPSQPQRLSAASRLLREEVHPSSVEHWALTQRGAILLRAGDASAARACFLRSIDADPRTGAAVLNWLWLTIASAVRCDEREATEWLELSEDWFRAQGGRMPIDAPRISLHLHNWLEAHVLRAEAIGLVEVLRTHAAATRDGPGDAP